MKYNLKLNPEIIIFYSGEFAFRFELISAKKTTNCELELSAIRNPTMEKYSFWIPGKINVHHKKLSNYLKADLKKQIKEFFKSNKLIPFDLHKSDSLINEDGSLNLNRVKRKSYGKKMKFFDKNLYVKYLQAYFNETNLTTIDL